QAFHSLDPCSPPTASGSRWPTTVPPRCWSGMQAVVAIGYLWRAEVSDCDHCSGTAACPRCPGPGRSKTAPPRGCVKTAPPRPVRRPPRPGLCEDRPAARLREEAEHRGILVDALDLDRGGLHPLEQVRQILGVAELDADERGPGLTVGAFDVLEHRDVVLGAEDLVEETAQGTGLLREVDDEVVLEAFVD